MRRTPVAELAAETVDVLVVGGGIYGLMTARDAALRGLSTVLVERDDWGGGTSHNSLKIMHGGIRYVQHLDLRRLRASARERAFWQRAAPGLVRPLDFIIPLFGQGTRGPGAFAAAAAIYGAASAGVRGPGYGFGGIVGAAEARLRMGDLAPEGLSGGGVWRDGQMRDANRLHLAALSAALEAGARAANHVEAVRLLRDGETVVGAALRDRLEGTEAELRARVVVSCTGARASDLAGPGAHYPGFARATNVVLDRPAGEVGVGVVSRSASDAAVERGGRMYFLTPWEGRTIAGTHEAPASDGRAREPDDVAAFLRELDLACPALAVGPQDVLWTYQGLIPADVDDGGGDVRRMTRGSLIDHRQVDGTRGLISVIGVKYTTARLIAERAVDRAAAQIDRKVPPSRSFETRLPDVGLASFDPADDAALAGRVRQALDAEMARTLLDIALRRTTLAETGCLDAPRLARMADIAAAHAGWDAGRRTAELAAAREAMLSR